MSTREQTKQLSFGIVGSGTAGLITALMLRKAFSNAEITVISSSQIGIIGVGEGSTEHWSEFMRHCDINLEDMIVSTDATHKYGISYENWTTHTPRYFHSVSDVDELFAWGAHATYASFIESNKLFTNQTTSVGLVKNKIRVNGLHRSTNQFHFDTHKLNEYFISLCFKRNIRFVEGIVDSIEVNNENGNIQSVLTDNEQSVEADFWFDASGFKKVLMEKLGNSKWNSFNDYLLSDSAIAFPTESDPSGEIRPYTRAIAGDNGWMWEIPTQQRRGNGYVFSSQFCDEEKAIAEAEKRSGYKISTHKFIKFDAGYMESPWVKNCVAIGLAGSFVEPLEATSIGSSIQQIKMMIPYLASYESSYTKSQKHFNKAYGEVMRNILTMIRLHYYSDRTDTLFWKAMSEMPVNDELQELLDIWSERPPHRSDVPHKHMELFLTPHIAHVAQGQGVFSSEPATRMIDRLNIRRDVENEVSKMRESRNNHELIDHAQALKNLHTVDEDWVL
jgi:tryptophan halogenase